MKLKLLGKSEIMPGVWKFEFESGEKLTWESGQFLRYTIDDPKPDERGVRRFFTIASAPEEGKIILTTRISKEKGSSFKNRLLELNLGEEIEAVGPQGSFIIEDLKAEYVLIAGGIGITPYRAMFKHFEAVGSAPKITLLYANRDEKIIFKEELEKVATGLEAIKIHYFIDPIKIDMQVIKKLVPDIRKAYFYISGPEPMVKGFEEDLKKIGVLEEQIKRDYFPGYESW